LEYAHSQAQQFLDKALSALTSLKESGAKEALIETAKFMAGRTFRADILATGQRGKT
jgi:geranylgeranyl pyrophosphate synthase